MALTKDKKTAIVEEVTDLMSSSKLTVVARYRGTSVKAMQDLRRQARQNHTKVRVVKNRLVKKAIEQSERLREIDTSFLSGQLLYAFNSQDEVAPARALGEFAKNAPQIEFVTAFSNDGSQISAEDVKALAALPTKEQLRGQLINLIDSPISGFTTVVAGNMRNVLNVLKARATS